MKQKLSFVMGALGIALLLLAFTHGNFSTKDNSSRKKIISCGPDWVELKKVMEETDIPVIPGAGSYAWKITTNSDSAQFYFNQGINMYYAFHIIESMASFKKAAKFDPDAAMLQWAQALAYGPNINDLGYAASPDALMTSERAVDISSNCTEKEKMLIRAQKARYSSDSTISRAHLNQVYADQMKKAYEAFPADADIAALYADALMLQHPWDLWSINGQPRPWTPQIREVLEKLLLQTPHHPGANHYYIHVMEASPEYALALPSADRLGALTPGLSHTVHMPSHIYLRAGHYEKGTSVNEAAVASYRKIVPLYNPVTGNEFLYVIHNLHMKTNNAMLAARSVYSKKSARETAASIPADYLTMGGAMANYLQYIHGSPILIDVKFGDWNALVKLEKPDAKLVFSNVLYHFGRGMGFAGKMNINQAKEELASLENVMEDSILYLPFTPFSTSIESARVARDLLKGTIALYELRFDDGISSFREAVKTEEGMVYNEPRDWFLNPGQYLGNALFIAGRYEEAKNAFLKDLQRNNENAWSLYGLWQTYKQLGRKKEAKAVSERFNKASLLSDITFPGAAY